MVDDFRGLFAELNGDDFDDEGGEDQANPDDLGSPKSTSENDHRCDDLEKSGKTLCEVAISSSAVFGQFEGEVHGGGIEHPDDETAKNRIDRVDIHHLFELCGDDSVGQRYQSHKETGSESSGVFADLEKEFAALANVDHQAIEEESDEDENQRGRIQENSRANQKQRDSDDVQCRCEELDQGNFSLVENQNRKSLCETLAAFDHQLKGKSIAEAKIPEGQKLSGHKNRCHELDRRGEDFEGFSGLLFFHNRQ